MQPEQLLELFKKDLENLKDNDKYKINALTIFARDHKDCEKIALGIVELTTRHVNLIPSGLKLLGLYVIDSIVKNVGAPFRKLYTAAIVDAFVHSFQAIRDEKGRLKLYNLRTTWKDIFPNSRMYELDIRVREHDPAWPLLAAPPESKAAFRSLPNIPKIQPKETTTSETQSTKVTISASRDPRLNRKRKSPTMTPSSSPAEDFLIDRSGDQKMEAVARKQGRQEVIEQPKKLSLFGGQDLDMRPQTTPPLTPSRSGVWSNYIDKHAEIGTRRELKDVDMRVSCPNDDKLSGGQAAANICPLTSVTTQQAGLPTGTSPKAANDTSHPLFVETHPPVSKSLVLMDTSAFVDSSRQARLSVPESNSIASIPILRHDVSLPPPPIPVFHQPNSQAFVNETLQDRLPIAPKQFHPPSRPQVCGPPIRGPVWSVEIYGFPDMVNIGVDPRMLSLVHHPKPPRRITIDGRRYSLLLDRVQPLIMVGDQVHAVRFRCEFATVLIDGRCFTIPGTGFTRIMVGNRPYQAYLGGPGHELVIDGRPHTVPLGSQLTFITVGYHSVGVRFVGKLPRNVNVLPPIPPRLLKWAGQGLFGSPRNLHRAPLNPLVELTRLAEGRSAPRGQNPPQSNRRPEFRNAPLPSDPSQRQESAAADPPVSNSDASSLSQAFKKECPSITTTLSAPVSVASSIDVHALFQKLVKAGIVSTTISQSVPDIGHYGWDRFKVPCTSETDALYSGHQCSQCGLRFHSDLSPEFASHLDYHYMKNSCDDQNSRNRNFYQTARYWLLSELTQDGAPQFDSEAPVPDLQESKCPAFADPSKNICAVCYEKFDVFWDHEEEEWMLRDALLVQDKAYHPICQEDAGKEFSQGNAVAHDMNEVQPELVGLKSEPPVCSTVDIPMVATSPVDDDAFGCEDHEESTRIPGLSPVPSPDSQDNSFSTVKQEPTEEPSALVKTEPSVVIKSEPVSQVSPEPREIIPFYQQISADPLAALKAVLHGGVSSLIQPPSGS
ncbi:Pre-mRNA cleavage complex 2 protein Pcf11 [Paragonimus westermani]|uniref:Pre-mRNA cleavage complex 2 protein Pcf11 n=1 Tax=Paragonimus westermani TaxID=34504 RepID=A0A8T0D8Y3_9TREM|nr:Pre-mRNA cleavage complex 2 protein Pcf11 [Paragonimus westermani]